MRWSPERLDQLERAVRDGRRVAVSRRGSEYVVTALRMAAPGGREGFIGRLSMTGAEMTFLLDELDSFQAL